MEIQRLLNLNVIKESNSPFFSPAFPLQKKNGDIRLVIDYRKLNENTQPMNFPIPRIHDYLQELGKSVIFSRIGLNMGYYQILIDAKDIEKTAFSLDQGHYEFLRMPFGLSNAPRTFQKAMNNMFKGVEYVKIYLDDILVHSENEEKHCEHLTNVLNILWNNGISINFEKTSFFKKEVIYLGHIICSEGIKPDISRIKTFNNYIPKTKKQLQKTLGLINWFRPYLKNISFKIATLTEKTRKNTRFTWDENDSKKIEDIWNEIKKQTLLNFPDISTEFILETDASDICLGAVLRQGNNCIGFFSYKLKNSEINYMIVEKQTLAIIKALNIFVI